MEKILCSAIWYDDEIKRTHLPKNIETGIVACGLRHCNCFTILKVIYPDRDYIKNNKDGKKTIQGFLTSANKFVNREKANEIAFDANQGELPHRTGTLFSEDIY